MPRIHRYRCFLPDLAEFTMDSVTRTRPSTTDSSVVRSHDVLSSRAHGADMAEREGFEPSVACATHDFQSCTFGHSVTSPEHVGSHEGAVADSVRWRRGGDSNPRYGMTAQRISNPPPSSTRPPLQVLSSSCLLVLRLPEGRSGAFKWMGRTRPVLREPLCVPSSRLSFAYGCRGRRCEGGRCTGRLRRPQ